MVALVVDSDDVTFVSVCVVYITLVLLDKLLLTVVATLEFVKVVSAVELLDDVTSEVLEIPIDACEPVEYVAVAALDSVVDV